MSKLAQIFKSILLEPQTTFPVKNHFLPLRLAGLSVAVQNSFSQFTGRAKGILLFSFCFSLFLCASKAQTNLILQEPAVVQKGLFALSPNNKYLVSGDKTKIQIFDVQASTLVDTLQISSSKEFSFTPDSRFLIIFADNNKDHRTCIYDLEKNRVINKFISQNQKYDVQKNEIVYSNDAYMQGSNLSFTVKQKPKIYRYALNTNNIIDSITSNLDTLIDYARDPQNDILYIVTGKMYPYSFGLYTFVYSLVSYNLSTKTIIASVPLPGLQDIIESCAISPRGTFLVLKTGFPHKFFIINTATGEKVSLPKEVPYSKDIRFSFLTFSPDEKYVFIGYDDRSEHQKVNNSYEAENQNPFSAKLKVLDIQNNVLLWEREDVGNLMFSPDGKQVLIKPNQVKNRELSLVTGLEFPSGKELYQIEPGETNKDCEIVYSKDGRFLFFIDKGKIKIYDIQNKTIVKSFAGAITFTWAPKFGPADNALYIPCGEDGIKIVQLKNITSPVHVPIPANRMKFSDDGSVYYYHDAIENKIKIALFRTDSILASLPLNKGEYLGYISISPHSVYLLCDINKENIDYKESRYFYVYNLKTKKLIRLKGWSFIKRSFTGVQDYLIVQDVSCDTKSYKLAFDEKPDAFIDFDVNKDGNSFQAIDLETGNVKDCWGSSDHSFNIFSSSCRYMTTFPKDSVVVIDRKNGDKPCISERIKESQSPEIKFSASEQSLYICYQEETNKRMVLDKFDLYTNKKTRLLENVPWFWSETYPGPIFEISKDEHYIAFLRGDGLIDVWDLVKKKALYSLAIFGPTDYMIITPDNYYYGTRGALDNIRFKKDNEVFSFQQFDLKYNRPDIVLRQSSESSPQLIQWYEDAYNKRLQKMGLGATAVETSILQAPTVQILNTEIPYSVSNAGFPLIIEATDENYLLDRINIMVNDVPVFGLSGFSVRGLKTKTYKKTFDLRLNSGLNLIKVSTVNAQGVESLKKTTEIHLNTPADNSNIYVIAIGVSNYANPSMKLDFAAKDAQDISNLFSTVKERVHVETILDEQFTLKRVHNLKTKLKQTQVDDKVIVFLAGHGIFDSKLNYYLATSTTDFNNPKENGMLYEELEHLLDSIPARQKLFLLDACHAGEIDKEGISLSKTKSTKEEKVKFRSSDIDISANTSGLQNSFNLMKGLFVDIRQGTGATVISSAGGLEFALEGEKWGNGVFTFSLLNGLKTMEADWNKDGQIMISELQKYLTEKVSQLTEGRQRPIFRTENITNDWRIWPTVPAATQFDPLSDNILNEHDLQVLTDQYKHTKDLLLYKDTSAALQGIDPSAIDRMMSRLLKDSTMNKVLVKSFIELEYECMKTGASVCFHRGDDIKAEGYLDLALKYWHFDIIKARESEITVPYNNYLMNQFNKPGKTFNSKSTIEKAYIFNTIGNLYSRKLPASINAAESAYSASVSAYKTILLNPESNGLIKETRPGSSRIIYSLPGVGAWDLIDFKFHTATVLTNAYELFRQSGDREKAPKYIHESALCHIEWLEKKGTSDGLTLEDILSVYKIAQNDNTTDLSLKLVLALIYRALVYAKYDIGMSSDTAPEDGINPENKKGLSLTEKSLNLFAEVVVMDNSPENRTRLCRQYGSLAWYQVLNKQFKEAVLSAKKGLEIDVPLERKEWINTNLALGYLFSGQYREAEKIYIALKDKPYGGATYKKAFLTDLNDLEKEGITHPDVKKIRDLLNK